MLKNTLIIALLCPVIFGWQKNSSENYNDIIFNYNQLTQHVALIFALIIPYFCLFSAEMSLKKINFLR